MFRLAILTNILISYWYIKVMYFFAFGLFVLLCYGVLF